MKKPNAGFTIIELLVTTLIIGIMMAAVVGAFVLQNHTYIQQDEAVELEENLRIGMSLVTDRLRAAGYGVPKNNLALWVPWVSGFSSNPTVVDGTPDSISVAGCFQSPLTTLRAKADKDAITLTLDDATGVDASTRRLLLIGERTNALVTAVSGDTVTIDTDPTTDGNQGLSRAYLVGTPICRVDVQTFSVDSSAYTFQVDLHQGTGAQPFIEHVSNFQITAVDASRYQVTLTIGGEILNVQNGTTQVERSLTSDVIIRNKL